jgi:hypothetical protein
VVIASVWDFPDAVLLFILSFVAGLFGAPWIVWTVGMARSLFHPVEVQDR